MDLEPSTQTPQQERQKEVLDDNARKFVVGGIDPEFLKENGATAFTLTVDWLEIDKDSETKVAHKKFDNGDIQILLISKITTGGNRTSEKEAITERKYKELLGSSILHLEKKRYEFEYIQNRISFSVKYDEFANSKLCIVEVDAPTEEERNAFNPNDFPSALSEVTGEVDYYGYKVANMV